MLLGGIGQPLWASLSEGWKGVNFLSREPWKNMLARGRGKIPKVPMSDQTFKFDDGIQAAGGMIGMDSAWNIAHYSSIPQAL